MALFALSPVARAAGALQTRLDDINARVDRLEQQISDLNMDYGQRRGLIGAVEARSRFEEAVYQYLVGDYEPAALTFFTLVDAQALTARPLYQDAEWYLAESLFELGNYATAADAYQRVVAEGTEHPFFADAVRRLLEVYGLLRDDDAFDDVYQRYIVTGRVQATDFVKYTVAKSLWRQGQGVRAKAMFADIAPDSASYMRGRYFLGAVLTQEGDYKGALDEFQLVVHATPTGDPSDGQVLELGWLAIGRLEYELGNYDDAVSAYVNVPKDSANYADQLYELVWTYIKEERWDEALQYLDVFLLAYPQHREAVNLELVRAQILMKEDRRQEALASYQAVVEDYTPVQAQLGELEFNHTDPGRYFRMLADPEQASADGKDLPSYAVEILVDDPYMARAVDVYKSMDTQQQDLQTNQQLIDQITEALRRVDRNVGTFARGRALVRGISDDVVSMQAAIVGYEIDYLLAKGNSADRGAIEGLSARFRVLQGRSAEVAELAATDTGHLQAWADQVQAVQALANRVRAANNEQLDQAQVVQTLLDENPKRLPADRVSDLQDQVKATIDQLQRGDKDLTQLASPSTRNSLLSMATTNQGDPQATQRALMTRDYAQLRSDVRRYRSGAAAGDAAQVFERLDQLWDRSTSMTGKASAIMRRVDSAEQTELAVLRTRLSDESDQVADSSLALRRVQDGASGIVSDIAVDGFGRLHDEIGQTVEDADVGIIDVYWLDKTDASDEVERLGRDRAKRMQELDDRFKVIHQKLQDMGASGATTGAGDQTGASSTSPLGSTGSGQVPSQGEGE